MLCKVFFWSKESFVFFNKTGEHNFPITFKMLAADSEMLATEIRMEKFTFDEDSTAILVLCP